MLFNCCSDLPIPKNNQRQNQVAEHIYRHHDEYIFDVASPSAQKREKYPWEEKFIGNYPKITKDFFRCNGSYLNPPVVISSNDDEKPNSYYDCGGYSSHGLSIHDDQEFIYPVLIDLLNYLQEQTNKRVIITCGHRCPKHNVYSDQSKLNTISKHMIGAEVDFYIQGMENNPEEIVQLIMDYYKNYADDNYREFRRYDKEDTNVSTPPWYNKEVFIKLFKKNEGRDFDNQHPYPYISVQVRYDRDKKKRVIYTWDQAYRKYAKW